MKDLPKRYAWYLALNARCEERAVFHHELGAAQDFAFEQGKGSAVISVADRGSEPDAGSALIYVAEEREFMIRDAEGQDIAHACGELACIRAAEDVWGKGTKVYRLGRDLKETGVVIYEVR